MKKNILFIIILLSGQRMLAQDKIILNVIYEFSYVRDLADKQNPYKANFILSLGKRSSRYCSERLYEANDANAKRERAKQQQVQSSSPQPLTVVSGRPLLVVNNHGAIINEEITIDNSGQQMLLNGILGFKTYKVQTSVPKIDWQINNDKKVIGDYNCQKATGTYGGRTYIVWFAPDLPFHSGPWKLSGLPGLILEARDTNNEVSFTFKVLTKNTDPDENTASFINDRSSIPADLKAYNRLKMEFDTDPEAVMTALAPNAQLAVKNIDDPQSSTVNKVKKYNPMELK